MTSIMLVENDLLSREMAERVLRAGGHRVVAVKNAEEALSRMKAVKPDLVLMDLNMPGIDGIEATRRILADPAVAGVRVAMLSAQSMDHDVQRAMEAGCIDYVTKPIAARDLLDRVAAILAGKGRGAKGGRIRR